mmetsp:Transcript_58500/g.166379  ORF Transcript_58500/g.166379 Transcript_58500/m.166379 type:complete len:252 (+) Transcript_58500:1283-2038(+)
MLVFGVRRCFHGREAHDCHSKDDEVQHQDAAPDVPVVAELEQRHEVPQAHVPDEVVHDAHVGADLVRGLRVHARQVGELEHHDAHEVLDGVDALQALRERVEAAAQPRRAAGQHEEEHRERDAQEAQAERGLHAPDSRDNHDKDQGAEHCHVLLALAQRLDLDAALDHGQPVAAPAGARVGVRPHRRRADHEGAGKGALDLVHQRLDAHGEEEHAPYAPPPPQRVEPPPHGSSVEHPGLVARHKTAGLHVA